jgi:V-type H+-transporting ATPase subunit a
LDTLERILEDKEQELLQLNSMHEKLTREYNERKELQEIISRAGEFFEIDCKSLSFLYGFIYI